MEWIQYHLRLGFSRIYVYDNSEQNTLNVYECQEINVIHLPGEYMQMNAYNHFFNTFAHRHKWCAVIDVDEFIVLKTHTHIVPFLVDHLDSGALAINWVLFGSNGHLTYTDEPVMKRFTKRQRGVNPHVKCIVCCDDVQVYNSCHVPTLRNGYVKDVHGRMLTGVFNHDGSDDICQINHYFVKSRDEFQEKVNRGRADVGRRTMVEFEPHDVNEIEEMPRIS